MPGRWDEVRPPTPQELKGTRVLALDLDEASAKVRTGPPVDDDEDYELDVWAGVIPLAIQAGPLTPDPKLTPGIEPSRAPCETGVVEGLAARQRRLDPERTPVRRVRARPRRRARADPRRRHRPAPARRPTLDGVTRIDIALTHFHLDHVCGLAYLPTLPVAPDDLGARRMALRSRRAQDLLGPFSPFEKTVHELGAGAAHRRLRAHRPRPAAPLAPDGRPARRRPRSR